MFCIPANYSKFNPPLNPPGDPPSEVILKNFDILGPCWFSSVDLPHARSKLGWTTLRFWRLTTVTSQSRSMPTSSSSGETGGSKWTCPRLGNTSVIWSRQYDYKDAWGRASLIMLLIISIKNWRRKKWSWTGGRWLGPCRAWAGRQDVDSWCGDSQAQRIQVAEMMVLMIIKPKKNFMSNKWWWLRFWSLKRKRNRLANECHIERGSK